MLTLMPCAWAALSTRSMLLTAVVDSPDWVGIITLHMMRMLRWVMPSFAKREKSLLRVLSVSVHAFPLDM